MTSLVRELLPETREDLLRFVRRRAGRLLRSESAEDLVQAIHPRRSRAVFRLSRHRSTAGRRAKSRSAPPRASGLDTRGAREYIPASRFAPYARMAELVDALG